MTKKLILILIFSTSNTVFAVGMDLKAAYESALNKTETILISKSRQEQAGEKISQARGSLLPKLSAIADYKLQDDKPPTKSTTGGKEYSDLYLNLKQPLFQGLSEYAALREVNAQYESETSKLEQQKLDVYVAVSSAYFDVLLSEQDLKDLKTLYDFNLKRVDELKTRSKIGRSRQSELLSAQTQLYTLQTDIKAAEAALKKAREEWAYVTGLATDAELTEPEFAVPEKIPELDKYLAAVSQRPDVLSMQQDLSVAEEQRNVIKGGHLPTIALTGNYYLKRLDGYDHPEWDATLNFTLPIYAGGVTASQVSEAASLIRQRELELSQKRRAIEKDIKVSHENVISGLEQTKTLKEGVEIAEKNYNEQNRDYRYGLSTNLDVLQALNTLQETKRALDRTRYQTLSAWVALEASIGKLQ